MIAVMSDAVEALWNGEARERILAAGDVLFRAGDPVRFVYWVDAGAMRLVRPLPNGTELTIQRAREGSVLAEASLFSGIYHCDAVAEGPARLRALPLARITQALERDPGTARALARHLAAEVQSARARAEIVALRTVRARLEAWLSLHDGELPARGRWREVAEEIGVTPEAFYRELAKRRGR